MRSAFRTDVPVPEPPFWGAREMEVDLDDVYPYLDRHVLFKLHWGGRGKKGEEWRRIVEGHGGEEGFAPRLERMWREQDYLHPRAKLGYFPAAAEGNELIVFDPEDPERELERLRFPRQPRHDRICLADLFRPLDSGERDVVALQAVTVGDEVTELMARLEKDGEFAEQLYTHGLGVQTAEGMAEWLHAEVRRGLGIELDQGRRYSWGYPACPDQSEHEKVWRLLGLEEIGMTLSDGYAVMPEQSTVAIVAHHPQAVYFGMKSGFVPEAKRPDELIAGTERGGELPPEADPTDGLVEAEVAGRHERSRLGPFPRAVGLRSGADAAAVDLGSDGAVFCLERKRSPSRQPRLARTARRVGQWRRRAHFRIATFLLQVQKRTCPPSRQALCLG